MPSRARARDVAARAARPRATPAAAVASEAKRGPRRQAITRSRLSDWLGPVARESGAEIATIGAFVYRRRRYEIPRIRLAGPYAGHDPIRLALFAGLHGDEPAGCLALVWLAAALAEHPERIAGYELSIYPVVNPVGYERDVRFNGAGLDLNREFWSNSPEAEVRALEAELRAQRFDGIVTLHSDDTCEGVYGYTHGRTLNEALLAPALRAASEVLPPDARAKIDGFAAQGGLICDCFRGILSAPPDQKPQPFDVIFETPAHAPLDRQVAATLAAVESILTRYPAFIAYGQDL